MRGRLRLAALGLVLALAGSGCTTLLDLERARNVLAPEGEPLPPVLEDRPHAALPAVEGLRAVSGQLRMVPLKWDPALDARVDGYVVERSLREDGGYQRIATVRGRFDTAFTDRGADLAAKAGSPRGTGDLGDGSTYYYQVRGYTAEGGVAAAASAVARAITAAVPEEPRDLVAYSHLPRQVALTWTPVEDPTVAGYVVYRSPAARGEFLPVARLDGAYRTTWVDRALGALRVFYYRVAAVNAAGGVGAATPAARAVTKPEPLPPAGLRVAAQRLGNNELAWEPNVEPDVTGYRLFRERRDGEGPELVATLDAGTTRAEDATVGAGETITYRVTAFDADDLQSGPSDPVEVTGVDYALRAVARGDTVELHWDPSLHAHLQAMKVLREGTLGSEELGRVPSEGFVQRGVEPGQHLRYRVVGIRPDGSEAPPSAIVEVTVPE